MEKGEEMSEGRQNEVKHVRLISHIFCFVYILWMYAAFATTAVIDVVFLVLPFQYETFFCGN